jgi:hypothetical protein
MIRLVKQATPTRRRRIVLVGLTGKQAEALRRRVGDRATLTMLTPDRALKFRGSDSDAVLMTRFIGHKHESHLRRVSTCPLICVRTGGVEAVARVLEAIVEAA